MKVDVQREHRWLQQLVGEWTYEGEAAMGPDHPVQKWHGSESVRRDKARCPASAPGRP